MIEPSEAAATEPVHQILKEVIERLQQHYDVWGDELDPE